MKSTVCENEELKGPFSPNPKKSSQNPPPGFYPLNMIVEETADKPINLKNFVTPDVPNTFTPDLSFMDNNVQQNSYSNFYIDTKNIPCQNELNSNTVTVKIKLEMMKMEIINNIGLILNQVKPGVTNADSVLLQEKLETLKKQLEEVKHCNAQLTNSNLQTPNLQNLNTNSCETIKSEASASAYPWNNLQNTNPSAATADKMNENRNFWNPKNVDDFFKGVPKIIENTNPFKTSLEGNKLNRSSLQRFYENPPPVPHRDPKFINKSKTKSGVSAFGNEDSSSNIRKPAIHNFDPVVSPTAVYEAGPVMYNMKESQTKIDNNIYDKSLWKPIPPSKEPSKSRESVPVNIPGFNITKPKSPSERLRELLKKTTEEDSHSNVVDTNSRDIITPTDFKTFQMGQDTHILIPGKLSNNEQENDEVSNCIQKDYHQKGAQTPPAQISVSVIDASPTCRAEIFATISEGRRLIENTPNNEERIETPFMNREVIDQTECSSANFVSSLKSTNPFIQDIALMHLNQGTQQELNKATKHLEAVKLNENFEESRTEQKVYTPSLKDDSSVCFLYQLNSKDMSIIVINMENEGWLCTDEFVTAFTTLIGGGSVLLSVLEMINLKVPFRIVDRSAHPSLMTELDFSPLRVQRDSQNRICRPVHLTPLKSALRILTKIKVIKREDMNTALANKQYKEGTILSDMMRMISSYGTFMRTKCKS